MPPPDVFLGNLKIFTGAVAATGSVEVFCKNDVFKNFTIFTEKRLCWSHLFKNVAESSCLQHCRFIKMRLQHRCFFVNIANFLKTRIRTFSKNSFLKS